MTKMDDARVVGMQPVDLLDAIKLARVYLRGLPRDVEETGCIKEAIETLDAAIAGSASNVLMQEVPCRNTQGEGATASSVPNGVNAVPALSPERPNVLGPGLEPAGSTDAASSSAVSGMEVANPREDAPTKKWPCGIRWDMVCDHPDCVTGCRKAVASVPVVSRPTAPVHYDSYEQALHATAKRAFNWWLRAPFRSNDPRSPMWELHAVLASPDAPGGPDYAPKRHLPILISDGAIKEKGADREQEDALRWRWWRANHMQVGRDEPGDWTCWVEIPCIPFRSQTTDPDEITDALIARFPLNGKPPADDAPKEHR